MRKNTKVSDESLTTAIELYYAAVQSSGKQRIDELEKASQFLLQISNFDLSDKSAIANKFKYAGLAYFKMNDLGNATICLDLSTRFGVSEIDVYRTMALIHFKRRQFRQSIAKFDLEIKDHPRNSEAYNDRGVVYFKTGKIEKAHVDFNRAIYKNKNNVGARMNRANTNSLKGNYEAALEDVAFVLGMNPNSTQALYSKAILNYVLEEQEEFKNTLIKATSCDVGSSLKERYFRAKSSLLLNEFQSALDDFTKVEPYQSELDSSIFLGDFYRFQEDKESAELCYFNAIKSFLDKKTKFVSDYLIIKNAEDGLKKIGAEYNSEITKFGVQGINGLNEEMINNISKLNI
ncbi:MAG: tetratricopeptide repeat protein [Candidatus Nanoarchaeia archaeon]